MRSRHPTYMAEQHIGYMRGTHAFKFGGTLYLPSGGNPDTDAGNVAYQTLADVMNNTPSSISFDSGRADHTWRFVNFGFFAQDDWRVNRKLVLNLGFVTTALATLSEGVPPRKSLRNHRRV